MPFADYTFYTEVYGGSTLSEESFAAAVVKSDSILLDLTFGRAAEHPETPALKLAACALAERLAVLPPTGVRSQSVGSHSVTYAEGSETASTGELYGLAERYLLPTGLCYRGIG